MKNIKLFVLAAAVPVIVSCSWKIPESVSVKTNAEYNFTIGTFSEKLSKYLSVDTLTKQMESSSSEVSFNVYDYYPDDDRSKIAAGGIASQKFLVDFSLQEIPIDIGSYLDKMNFADQLKGMSFAQTFDVPDLSVSSFDKQIDLPDINEEIRKSADLNFGDITISQGINGTLSEEQCPSQNVTVKAPEFTELEFYSGSLDLSISCKETPVVSTNLKISLLDGDGKEITSVSNVDLLTQAEIFLPLAGKTLVPKMKLKVSGTSSGGTSGNNSTYSISASFSDDSTISRATGLTMSIDPVSINQAVKIETEDAFVSCEIGDKSETEKSILSITTKLPDGWTGVTATREINLSGAITAADSEFDKTVEGGEYLINRTLPLKDKTYSKKGTDGVLSGYIKVGGTINISLNNAEIVLPDGNAPQIMISTSCSITKVTSMTIDLSKYESPIETVVEVNEELPSEVSDFIEKIQLKPSGMNVEYYNTLPEGNDIDFTVDSGFFGITNKTGTMKGGMGSADNPSDDMKFLGTEKTVDTASDKTIDFKAEMEFPGKTAEHPHYVTLENIEIGKSYAVGVTVEPVFDWESIKLKTAMTEVKGNVDTGLNVSEIFKSLTDELGDDSFISRIGLKEIPLYLYSIVPEIVKDFTFEGHLTAAAYDEEGQVVGKEKEIQSDDIMSEYSVLPALQKAAGSDSIVTGFGDTSQSTNIADLFNIHASGNIKIDYDFQLGKNETEGGDSVIMIAKTDLEQFDEDSVSIRLHARLVLPLELKVAELDENPNEPVVIDIMKLMDLEPGDDLFSRSEPTDLDDMEKYIDAIDSAGIRYSVKNNVLQSDKVPHIELDTKNDNLRNKKYAINFSTGTLNIEIDDMKDILRSYPFSPTVKLEIPVGTYKIPRNAEAGVGLSVYIKTDGTVNLFGGDE
ncbi:MAG: hypothetical protein SPF11_00175 [Treponema porcinum]|uniref:hypothetical protein n=1 Tax=Treponema porcinum TaxID=261392 RepID=UPI002355C7FF|nr:hypothetical protein [Treponema porcinum]MCI7545489.1 hypothetical protein [Treponema porcinum]MDY4190170.1 hypothetical protein [Treponema porcinum]MDY5047954.1 hypothetical protein [Treponema porcinum]